jgi:hypothetical protein
LAGLAQGEEGRDVGEGVSWERERRDRVAEGEVVGVVFKPATGDKGRAFADEVKVVGFELL